MGIRFVDINTAKKLQDHRVHQWIDTKTCLPMFGVQTRVDKRAWAHVVENSTPVLFAEREPAAALIKMWKVNEGVA